MIVYLVIVVLLILLGLTNNSKPAYVFGCLTLLVLSCVRDSTVGTDTQTYVNIFKGSEEYFREIEPGYALFMHIVKVISDEQQAFLIASSLLILLPVFFFIDRTSSNRPLSLLLFVILFNFYFSLSALRQGIAASIILLSLYQLMHGKIKTFIALVLLASSFHTTAIMVLPIALVFYKYQISKKAALIALIVSFIVGWFDLLKVREIVVFLQNYNVGGGLVDVSKYSTYAEYTFGDSVNNINAKIFNMVPNTAVSIAILALSDKKVSFFNSFFWLGTIIINLFVEIPIAFRVAYYLTFFQVISIPNMFLRSERKRLLYISFVSAFIFLFVFETNKKVVYKMKNPMRNDVVPYKTF